MIKSTHELLYRLAREDGYIISCRSASEREILDALLRGDFFVDSDGESFILGPMRALDRNYEIAEHNGPEPALRPKKRDADGPSEAEQMQIACPHGTDRTNVIDLQRIKADREAPDADLMQRDDYGRPMYSYGLEYRMDGQTWTVSLMAYSLEDAEQRAQAMRETISVYGQIISVIPV
jgi:hypothetical protein